MDKASIWKLTKKKKIEEKEPISGVHSTKLENLGELREINKISMISISKLVNLGTNVVAKVLFRSGVHSEAYAEIKRKANQISDDESLEFEIMRVSLEIMSEMLKSDLYEKIHSVIDTLEEQGLEYSIQECVIDAVKKSLNDKRFVKELLNQSQN